MTKINLNPVIQTTNRIPGIVAKIEAEEAREMKKIQSAKTFGESSKIFKSCTATLVAIAGVVAAVACPPALIFLPMALPLISLVTDALEKKVTKKIVGGSHPDFLSAFGFMRRNNSQGDTCPELSGCS